MIILVVQERLVRKRVVTVSEVFYAQNAIEDLVVSMMIMN